MNEVKFFELSRRERQILDIVYQRGFAGVSEVREGLTDPPGYSAVRALLRVMEDKGLLQHEEQGARYVYYPTISRKTAGHLALKHLLATYFDDSVDQMIAALLQIVSEDYSEETKSILDRIIDTLAGEQEQPVMQKSREIPSEEEGSSKEVERTEENEDEDWIIL